MAMTLTARAAGEVTERVGQGAHTMQCMEVWGGNEAADAAVRVPGLDVWVYSRPYRGDASGGDVHYVSKCGTGRIARLLVADVSGHGKEVSTIAVTLRGLMRKFVNFLDQSRFVAEMNREFAAGAEGGTFATALVGTYWAPTQYLVTSNAGHPRPFHYRARTGTWELLDPGESAGVGQGPSNLPLGIVDESSYDSHGVRLERGDLVLIYTDSLTEARRADGTLLGEEGLIEVLRSVDVSRPETFVARLIGRLGEVSGGQGFSDDATVMLLRGNGLPAARQGLGEYVRGAWLFAGLVISRLMGGRTPIPWPEMSVENIGGAIFPRLSLRWGRAKAG